MNTDKYILQEVTTSAQEREWLDLPKKIYKGPECRSSTAPVCVYVP